MWRFEESHVEGFTRWRSVLVSCSSCSFIFSWELSPTGLRTALCVNKNGHTLHMDWHIQHLLWSYKITGPWFQLKNITPEKVSVLCHILLRKTCLLKFWKKFQVLTKWKIECMDLPVCCKRDCRAGKRNENLCFGWIPEPWSWSFPFLDWWYCWCQWNCAMVKLWVWACILLVHTRTEWHRGHLSLAHGLTPDLSKGVSSGKNSANCFARTYFCKGI